ncbi:MAG: methionine biosynthesis protein MetW [Desulfomonile tiedjei]|uniref:Methionine biosynthesis protein MetW n=1 Tax=Desulfomonile tiedjei TaxID=2358 RepID=A0A9D6V1A6_9BACT|nr:methionine biosynthesis protein MetW [Desulfomonile tiedjei]
MSNGAPQTRTPFHQFEVGFNIIIDLITPGTRVLDLGCGSGTLLQRLRDEKDVEGCGVELDQAKVIRCIERGVRVMALDLDQGLEGFPDLSYEYVVLSRTLQQLVNPERLVKEMLRVASKSIIAFPNFGHWRILLDYVVTGRTPTSDAYPDPWYNSPDIHRITISDFRDFVKKIGAKIEREIFITEDISGPSIFWPNRRAEWGCFQISGS